MSDVAALFGPHWPDDMPLDKRALWVARMREYERTLAMKYLPLPVPEYDWLAEMKERYAPRKDGGHAE